MPRNIARDKKYCKQMFRDAWRAGDSTLKGDTARGAWAKSAKAATAATACDWQSKGLANESARPRPAPGLQRRIRLRR
jgi:hypothetical protein